MFILFTPKTSEHRQACITKGQRTSKRSRGQQASAALTQLDSVPATQACEDDSASFLHMHLYCLSTPSPLCPSHTPQSQELRKNQLGRYMEAAEEELGDMDDAEMIQQQQSSQQQQPQAAMMASLSLARLVGVPMNVAMAASHTSSSTGSSSSSSAPVMRLTAPGSRPFWGTSHPPMASMSMGMGHASRVLLNAFQSAARAVPTHSTRPRLQRPAKGSDGKQ